VRPAPGYYKALNDGERAATVLEDLLEENEEETTSWALASAEREPTLKEALSGPDAEEWQQDIDYEIGQLEKLGTWEVTDPP
ncbi:hypothetical protein P692DRAFT_20648548, partial [Suillus brevipes Sb2]